MISPELIYNNFFIFIFLYIRRYFYMVSKKCYNYKGKYCKDWKVLGTVPDDLPDLCETACKGDPTCRGQFTYLDPNNRSKTCFHCTGKEKNPDIDKPISPFPLVTDDLIQDLEICYDDNYLKKQKVCSWGDLSAADKKKALKDNCKISNIAPHKLENYLVSRCDWNYIDVPKRTNILSNKCPPCPVLIDSPDSSRAPPSQASPCTKGRDDGRCGEGYGKCNRYINKTKTYCSKWGWCGPESTHGGPGRGPNTQYDSDSSMCAIAPLPSKPSIRPLPSRPPPGNAPTPRPSPPRSSPGDPPGSRLFKPCPINFYKDYLGGKEFCRGCPHGYSSQKGSIGISSCVKVAPLPPPPPPPKSRCGKNQYLDQRGRTRPYPCKNCPSDRVSPVGSTGSNSCELVVCPANHYRNHGERECRPCVSAEHVSPAGSIGISSCKPVVCPANHYRDSGRTHCWSCPPYTTSPRDSVGRNSCRRKR